jgi:hypothetical protein
MGHFFDEHETVAMKPDLTSLASYLAANRIENACIKIGVAAHAWPRGLVFGLNRIASGG